MVCWVILRFILPLCAWPWEGWRASQNGTESCAMESNLTRLHLCQLGKPWVAGVVVRDFHLWRLTRKISQVCVQTAEGCQWHGFESIRFTCNRDGGEASFSESYIDNISLASTFIRGTGTCLCWSRYQVQRYTEEFLIPLSYSWSSIVPLWILQTWDKLIHT